VSTGCNADLLDVATMRELIGALLLRHTCQLVGNAHAITVVIRVGPQQTTSIASTVPTGARSDGSFSIGAASTGGGFDGMSSAVDMSQQVRIATAIYPTASLMNHSCDPSVISRSATGTDCF